MTIRVKLAKDPARLFELAHRRHFFMALQAHPRVSVTWDAGAEVDVYIAASGPPRAASMSVFLPYFDPHGAPADIDIRDTLDPDQIALLVRAGFANMLDWFSDPGQWAASMRKRRPGSFAAGMARYDLVATRYPECHAPFLEQAGRPVEVVPYYLPPHIFHATLDEDRHRDVFFAGASGYHYPLRRLMLEMLRAAADVDFLHGSPPWAERPRWEAEPRLFDVHQTWYADQLRHTKLTMIDGGVFNYPVGKYFEAMACGCLVLAPIPKDGALLGFVDGETMVAVDGDSFEEQMRYLLAHPEERRRIAGNALELARQWSTVDVFVDMLERRLG